MTNPPMGTYEGEAEISSFNMTNEKRYEVLFLEKVIDAGLNTEEKIAGMTPAEMVQLPDITTEELDKGWIFNLVVSYMGEVPEEWQIPITEETVKEYKSTGKFSLIEE